MSDLQIGQHRDLSVPRRYATPTRSETQGSCQTERSQPRPDRRDGRGRDCGCLRRGRAGHRLLHHCSRNISTFRSRPRSLGSRSPSNASSCGTTTESGHLYAGQGEAGRRHGGAPASIAPPGWRRMDRRILRLVKATMTAGAHRPIGAKPTDPDSRPGPGVTYHMEPAPALAGSVALTAPAAELRLFRTIWGVV